MKAFLSNQRFLHCCTGIGTSEIDILAKVGDLYLPNLYEMEALYRVFHPQESGPLHNSVVIKKHIKHHVELHGIGMKLAMSILKQRYRHFLVHHLLDINPNHHVGDSVSLQGVKWNLRGCNKQERDS